MEQAVRMFTIVSAFFTIAFLEINVKLYIVNGDEQPKIDELPLIIFSTYPDLQSIYPDQPRSILHLLNRWSLHPNPDIYETKHEPWIFVPAAICSASHRM